MHGGLSTGAPLGNKNALKHGRYTAEAISRRKQYLSFGGNDAPGFLLPLDGTKVVVRLDARSNRNPIIAFSTAAWPRTHLVQAMIQRN